MEAFNSINYACSFICALCLQMHQLPVVQVLHHLHLLPHQHQHPQLMDVDHPNGIFSLLNFSIHYLTSNTFSGKVTIFAMMKTTMLNATMMEEIVAETMSIPNTAQFAHAWTLMQQPQLLLQHLLLQALAQVLHPQVHHPHLPHHLLEAAVSNFQ